MFILLFFVRFNREMSEYTPPSGYGRDGKPLASSTTSAKAAPSTSSSSTKTTGKGKKGETSEKKAKKVKDKNAPKG